MALHPKWHNTDREWPDWSKGRCSSGTDPFISDFCRGVQTSWGSITFAVLLELSPEPFKKGLSPGPFKKGLFPLELDESNGLGRSLVGIGLWISKGRVPLVSSVSPTSLFHASIPPTSIIGIRLSIFRNACSLITRTRVESGVFPSPKDVENSSYTATRSNLSRLSNKLDSCRGAITIAFSIVSAVTLRRGVQVNSR